ncbi:unnamed protein product [Malus baccata var. baccata]
MFIVDVVELATKKEESYRGRVNNLSQASHVLGVLRHKFNDAHLANFRASYFGHLDSVDKLTFNGQLMHELLLLTYFPQKFGFVGESSKGKGKGKGVKGKGKVKIALKKATKKVLVTCVDLEMVFKEYVDEDDVLKMRLVYFAERAKSNVGVNLEYLDLIEDMDRFNTYSWGEGEENGMVMRNEMRRMKRNNRWEVRGGRDLDGATKSLPLCYCKMTDHATLLRIPRWSTKNK